MPTTPTGLRYPGGDELLRQGDNAMRLLAEDVDAQLTLAEQRRAQLQELVEQRHELLSAVVDGDRARAQAAEQVLLDALAALADDVTGLGTTDAMVDAGVRRAVLAGQFVPGGTAELGYLEDETRTPDASPVGPGVWTPIGAAREFAVGARPVYLAARVNARHSLAGALLAVGVLFDDDAAPRAGWSEPYNTVVANGPVAMRIGPRRVQLGAGAHRARLCAVSYTAGNLFLRGDLAAGGPHYLALESR